MILYMQRQTMYVSACSTIPIAAHWSHAVNRLPRASMRPISCSLLTCQLTPVLDRLRSPDVHSLPRRIAPVPRQASTGAGMRDTTIFAR